MPADSRPRGRAGWGSWGHARLQAAGRGRAGRRGRISRLWNANENARESGHPVRREGGSGSLLLFRGGLLGLLGRLLGRLLLALGSLGFRLGSGCRRSVGGRGRLRENGGGEHGGDQGGEQLV